MAEQALSKLRSRLNCPICLDTYTDPKQLRCNHVCCQQCLGRLATRDQQGQLILTCPNCRQVTLVPASGVAGLQAAFQINQFLEIVEEHKKATTSHQHSKAACPEHRGREMILFCETCEHTICIECTKNTHTKHDYFELDEAFERYKKKITSSLKPMEKQLATIKRALAQMDTCCDKIYDQQETIEASIHDTFAHLHKTLDVRKTELIGQLHRRTQDKLKSLAVQREQIETTQAQLSSCLHFITESLKTGNQGEALLMKSTTVRQVKELTTTFQADLLEPNAEANLILSASADITAVIQEYGQVLAENSPNLSKCTVTGNGLKDAALGKKSAVLLQTRNSYNQPCEAAQGSITCELASEMTGTRVRGSVERRGQSQYEISYQPTIKGRHQLHIKVEGQHVKFPIGVKSPMKMLGIPILSIRGVNGPEGVAVNQRGEVVVAESEEHCVSVFSPSGEKLRSFGKKGSDKGQFSFPRGVAVDGEGHILVADNGNNRIQKFTMEGKFLAAGGNGPVQLSNPRGIAYNASNSKVYVGNRDCHIQILNYDLSYAGSFGERGYGNEQFIDPQYLACDSTGNVYVADIHNHCIKVFTAEGKFLRMIANGTGTLRAPNGLAIDSSDRVYVTELKNHRVSVFTSEGQLVKKFGKQGSGPGQFYFPSGIAVDSSGVVYVCDEKNSRIQLF